jgi:putative iron-regulated protein
MKKTIKKQTLILGASITLFGLISCKETTLAPLNKPNENQSQVIHGYAKMVSLNYNDALTDAKNLQQTLQNLVKNPSESSLESAKKAWLKSRESYGQSEVYRFYEGPIDNEAQEGPEGQLNAWPLDEGYIDYVINGSQIINNGLIQDTSFVLSKPNLISKNEDGGETNIATGYHAIEFLLWGQDINSEDYITLKEMNPGRRPFTDFSTDINATRRGVYINLVAEILVEDLTKLELEWKADASNYRHDFENRADKESLKNILLGMGFLSKGELSGERMRVALENHDQEDEHSCFSDNTHRDIILNNLGIYNAYFGHYNQNTFPGIRTLLSEELKKEADAIFTATKFTIESIQAPFDVEIAEGNQEGNARVKAGIDALSLQAGVIVKIAQELEVGELTVQ